MYEVDAGRFQSKSNKKAALETNSNVFDFETGKLNNHGKMSSMT